MGPIGPIRPIGPMLQENTWLSHIRAAYLRRWRRAKPTPASPSTAAPAGEGTLWSPIRVSVTLLYCTAVDSDHAFPKLTAQVPVPNMPIGTSMRKSEYGPGWADAGPSKDHRSWKYVVGPPISRSNPPHCTGTVIGDSIHRAASDAYDPFACAAALGSKSKLKTKASSVPLIPWV